MRSSPLSSLSGRTRLGRRSARVAVAALAVAGLPLAGAVTATSAQAAVTELFVSEYVEGSSNNKAIEIFNGTGAAVDLATGGYNVQMYFNGSASAGLTVNLTGTVAPGDVFVLAQASANATILAQADQTNGAGWFNGDDAVVLRKGSTVIDVVGQIGVDPGTEWGSGLTSTADNTLRRKGSVEAGDPNGADAFDPAVEWDGFATDAFDGLGAHTVSGPPQELAPSVATVVPADGATNVDAAASVTVTFSEPVQLAAGAVALACTTSGTVAATVSGGPSTYSLDPGSDLASGEVCTVTVSAAGVTDVDVADPPDTMAADFVSTFTVARIEACGDPATAIGAVQGSGATSTMVGQVVSVEGVVVGDYQGSGQFGGYHVQDAGDGNPATSDGIFVFNSSFPVAEGDLVRVTGTVGEFVSSGQSSTQLSNVTSRVLCSTGNEVAPTAVQLPVSSLTDWEALESMRVSMVGDLTVTEVFTLGRFGEVSLSTGGRLFQPTHLVEPGAEALALQELNNRSRILLDDANNQQNIDPVRYPDGGLSATNTLRVGDTASDVSGVLEQRFGAYRIQPTSEGGPTWTATNPRQDTPDAVDGQVRVGSFNVLNYFNGDGLGGGFPTSRGAENPFELERQRAKIVSALVAMDSHVVGLNEIENDGGPTSALADLVAGLNEATAPGTYDYIETGVVGTDEIKVAMIYQPAVVTPVGAYAVLDASVDPDFDTTRNRPAIAQTFEYTELGTSFTVVANHLKSKGSGCGAGDDTTDGSGNCDGTRTRAAQALARWLETDPTGSGDADVLVVGDLNSYAKERPIQALEDAGYTNLLYAYDGDAAYSYVFDGQSGYLDHALASETALPQVKGVTEWHINADEPIVLDYNTNFKTANQVQSFFAPGPFRSSDHDALIVGLTPAWDFGGFTGPALEEDRDTIRAGSALPVRFSLDGFQGLDVLAGTPTVRPCGSTAVGTPVTLAGDLEYDALTDSYELVWKTDRSLAGSCAELVVRLVDDTEHVLEVQFR
jgi:predicted extracellular nuclease